VTQEDTTNTKKKKKKNKKKNKAEEVVDESTAPTTEVANPYAEDEPQLEGGSDGQYPESDEEGWEQ
jgi:hypothetical protein